MNDRAPSPVHSLYSNSLFFVSMLIYIVSAFWWLDNPTINAVYLIGSVGFPPRDSDPQELFLGPQKYFRL